MSSSTPPSATRAQPLDPAEAVATAATLRSGDEDLPPTVASQASDLASFSPSTSSPPSPARSRSPSSDRGVAASRPSSAKLRRASAGTTSSTFSSFRNFFGRPPAAATTSNFAALDHWLTPLPPSSLCRASSGRASSPPASPSFPPKPTRTVSGPVPAASAAPYTPARSHTTRSGKGRPSSAGTGAVRFAGLAKRKSSQDLAGILTAPASEPLAPLGPLPASHDTASSSPVRTQRHSHSNSPPPSPSPMSALFSPARPSPPGGQPPSSSQGASHHSSSSPQRARTTELFHPSKLVKRANRQSRFLPSLAGGAGEAVHAAGGGTVDPSDATRSRESLSAPSSGTGRQREKSAATSESGGFFEEIHPVGGLEVQPYARDMQSFVSYSHGSQNWDSLRTSTLFLGGLHGCAAYPLSEPTSAPPKRVLDIGGGVTPHWILAMAERWQETSFVALDIAPSSVAPELLPSGLERRVDTVQHDLRQPLPFEDGAFDFVRVGFVNLALGEQHWASLIEEAMRVLQAGCLFEVVEQDFTVWRKRPSSANPTTPTTPSMHSSFDPSDRFATIDTLFDDVLNSGFVNPSPLSVIPSDLAMNGTQLRSTGRISFPIPAAPRTYSASAPSELPSASHDPAVDNLAMHLSKYSAGSTAASSATLLQTNESRVILAAYADLWAGSSYGVAHGAVSARARARSTSRRRRASSGPEDLLASAASVSSGPAFQKEVQDVEDALVAWTDDLRERAGIAELLTSRFGWEPTLDRQLLGALEETLPVYDGTLRELAARKEVQEDVFGELDPEIEARMAQVEYARREAEAEKAAVRRRLFGPPLERRGEEKGEVLGSADYQAFVLRAY